MKFNLALMRLDLQIEMFVSDELEHFVVRSS